MEEQAKYNTKKQQYVIGIDPDVDVAMKTLSKQRLF